MLVRRVPLLLAALAFGGAAPASAAPFTTTFSAASVVAGQQIVAALNDAETEQLLAATLVFTYDPAVFQIVDVAPGSLTGAFDLFANIGTPGTVIASLAGLVESDGESGSLLLVTLQALQSAAPGPSLVSFQCDEIDPGIPCNGDYFVPLTSATADIRPADVTVPAPAVAGSLLALVLALRVRRPRIA